MAVKIFAIKSKSTGAVERLVKAETLSQVKKHLSASIEIEAIGAVEIVDIMASGTIRVEDATAQADDEGGAGATEQTPAAPAAADAGQPSGDAGQPSGDAGQPSGDAGQPSGDGSVAQ